MHIVKLFTKNDNKSYFSDLKIDIETQHPLGNYSKKFPVEQLMFRNFPENCFYDWHVAPQTQYIVYLEGLVEIVASGGETRVFKSGDILFVTDTTGDGHTTRTLTKGRSLIITT
jgi:hypothetical protein